jgi:nucleoside phosphorylase
MGGEALVDLIDRELSLPVSIGSITPGRVDVAYVGPGKAGSALLVSLLEKGIYRTVCFCGLAGGLSPALQPGDVVAGSSVRSPGSPEHLVSLMFPSGRFIYPGVILSVDRLVALSSEKIFLHSSEGADTVDMESYSWIGCAEKAKVPAFVLRVISDCATESLPPELISFVTPSGATSISGIFWAVLSRPAILAALWSMGRSIRLARSRLSELGALLRDCASSGSFPEGLR